jgi:hypothetical protein
MDDPRCEQFFREPRQRQQRHYEALRAFFLEHRSLPDIARQFGFTHGTVRNLVCRFRAACRADQLPPFLLRHHADDLPAPPAVPRPHGPRPRPSPTAGRSHKQPPARCVRASPGLSCFCRC